MAVLLGIVALLGLRPWATDSVVPNVIGVSPGVEARVGGAVAVAHTPALAVAPERVVASAGPAVAATRVSAPVGSEAGPILAVAPARPLQSASPPAPPAPSVPPAAAPEPAEVQPVAAPPETATPVVAEAAPPPATAGSGGSGGPIVAGVEPPEEPAEACEATGYTVTVAFDVEAIAGGRTDAEIVLRRVGSDGSETELHVEGGLDDLNALLDQFASEGPCVTVELEPLAGDGTTPPAEPSEAPESTLP